ncbi:hypothetical protein C8R45DRAFT_1104951 [Mycena sanguinolenta]|nr:hypothetical protein C8R45DRAFT_1104951 [Mycena sanguinolenta]
MSHNPAEPPAYTVLPGASGAASFTAGTATPTLSVSAPAPVTAFQGVAPAVAPITSYQGVPPTVAGSTSTRRLASALRTLPQHQAILTSSQQSSHCGSRRPFPSASPFSQNVSVLVAIYPLTIPGIYEPAGFGTHPLKARNDDMLDVLHRLQAHDLLVSVSVPRQGLASPVDFTRQIGAALAVHGKALPPSPHASTDPDAGQLTKQPLALLSPTRRLDIITFKPHPTISANSFGIEEFTKLGRKFANPDPTAGPNSILIFIGNFLVPLPQFI